MSTRVDISPAGDDSRALVPRVLATLALCCLAPALLAAAPARAAFPGAPGPIAYSRVTVGETTAEFSGGLFRHGPSRGDPPEQLTTEPWDRNPSYSADGRLVVFESRRPIAGEPQGTHIFVMRSDGSGVRPLTRGAAFHDANPAFAPGGGRVVFDRRSVAGEEPSRHIFSVGLGGGGLRRLTSGAVRDSDPVYTPGGGRIVFVSDRGRATRSDIFSMRSNGTRLRRLIGGPRREASPDVSPNGRKIVFASGRRGKGLEIFTASIDGRRLHRLTAADGDCSRACDTDPVWSPSGRHIAFLHNREHGSALEVMRADGRGAAKEFAAAERFYDGYGTSVGAPAWGPLPRR